MTAMNDNLDFCRICESIENLEKIFDEKNVEILQMLRSIAPSKIKFNDGLPKYICAKCTHKLINIFNFKSLYESTYYKFKRNYQSNDGRSLECQQDETELESFIIEEVDGDIFKSEIAIEKVYVEYPPKEAERNQELEITEPHKEHYSCQLYDKTNNHENDLKHSIQPKTFQTHVCNEYEANLKQSLQIKLSSGMQKDTELLHSNPEVYTRKWDQCEKTNFTEHHLKERQSLYAEKSSAAVNHLEFYASDQDFYLNPAFHKCDNCGKGYKDPASLKRHKCDGYKCDTCGKTYARKTSLTEHESSHINPNLFKCDHCDKTFTRLNNLKLHKVTHFSLNSLKCKECGKSFKNQRRLAVHVKSH